MRKHKLKHREYLIYEDMQELPVYRWAEIQKYIIAIEWGATAGEVSEKLSEFERGFNESKMNECYLMLSDMRRGLAVINEGVSFFEKIFALIVVDQYEHEDSDNYKKYISESHILEKVEKFRKLGITSAQISEAIYDFIRASPGNYNLHLVKTLERLLTWLASTLPAK